MPSSPAPSTRPRLVVLLLFVPVSALIIALFGAWGLERSAWTQLLATLVQSGYIVALWRVSDQRLRAFFLAGLLLGYPGEAVCLYVFPLYHYAVGGLPGYVALGHAMLVWACTALADLWPAHAVRRWQLGLTAAAFGLAVFGTTALHDTQSLLLFACLPLAWLFVRSERARLAIIVSFFGGLLIELHGTAVGAWEWHRSWGEYFTLGAGFTNPPFGVGGLYALAESLAYVLVPALAVLLHPSTRTVKRRGG